MHRVVLPLTVALMTLPLLAAISPPTLADTPTPTPVCDCSKDTYNCQEEDFANQAEAQACLDDCLRVAGKDVHDLDHDSDGIACESLPLGLPPTPTEPPPTATTSPPTATPRPTRTPLPTATPVPAATPQEPGQGGISEGVLIAIIGAAATLVAAVLAAYIAHLLQQKQQHKPGRNGQPPSHLGEK